MLPFCIGISIGMISALLLKRTEVDKLSKLLKQTEDLVQDLQEELEMKDSLSVKELAYGTYESQKLKHGNSKTVESSGPGQNQNLTPHTTSRDECDCQHLNKNGENSESLRKIEAELEAELERLEQNMNACSMEQQMSDLCEVPICFLSVLFNPNDEVPINFCILFHVTNTRFFTQNASI